ncbi:MAG: hypothetical protein KDD55_07095, partial [Bdellovibrionales bacterium]|nr:hypothetical protein [Bdellovibrionales bacterium]
MSKEKNTPAHLKGMSGEHDLPCGRMLSLEELSPVLRGSVQDLLSQTKESGVLVGAMLGARKWDVRPILLENSQLSIVRFAHPDCTLRDAYRYDVAAYFASLASHVSSSGIVHDQYWIRRPYFDRILIDEDLSRETISGIARPILLRRLLDAVGSLHAQKIFHGHLILSNLVLANDTLQLLDTGLRVLDKEMWRGLDGVPPELREGSPSEQTDVYWMARLIEILAPDIFTGSHPNLCTSMLSAEPGKRPRLMEVSEVLFPDTRKKMHQIDTPSLLRNPSAQLPSGKILAPHVERTKREAPKEQPKTEAREEPVQKAPASSSPSPASVAPSIKPTPPEKAEAQSMLPYLLFVLIGLCVYLAYQNGYFSSAAEFPSAVRPYTSLWQAGSVEERHEVARAAVIDNVSEAQKAIVRTALSGKEVPLVANSFIQKAFSSKFGTRFSQDDVRTVLRIALAPMLSDENLSAPDLASLDPRIVLALIETLGLSAEQAWFPSYPTERFFELPNPAKGIFQSLAQRGEANLSSLLVHATAVLVADPSQQEAWRIVL